MKKKERKTKTGKKEENKKKKEDVWRMDKREEDRNEKRQGQHNSFQSCVENSPILIFLQTPHAIPGSNLNIPKERGLKVLLME
jgi:hypothetical protein